MDIQSTDRAFAAILGNGRVVTWGSADYGGNSAAVQEQLRHVQQIQASDCVSGLLLLNLLQLTIPKSKRLYNMYVHTVLC